MSLLNFKSCSAKLDVWTRPVIKSDGNDHYGNVLLCTEDALVVSKNSEPFLRDELRKHFELKQESIGLPKFCLGGSVRNEILDNEVDAWALD